MNDLDPARLNYWVLIGVVVFGIGGNFFLAMVETNFDLIIGGQILVIIICSMYAGARYVAFR